MAHMVTRPEELKALLTENGPDEPANAAFLSNLSGWSAREILAADTFWDAGDVAKGFSFSPPVKVYVNDNCEPPGVAVLEDLPRGRWSRGRRFMVVRCGDLYALEWIFSLLPADEVCEVEVEQQDLLPEIEKRAIVKGCYERLYFTVERESFKLRPCEEVVWLDEGSKAAVMEFSRDEAADDGLASFYLALQLTGFPFTAAAVIRSEKISSFCCVGKKTERVWSVKWVCTRAGRRRSGEGRRLLSAATVKMLEMGRKPLYSARDSNVASRRLCESLGYKLVSVRTHIALVPKAAKRSGR